MSGPRRLLATVVFLAVTAGLLSLAGPAAAAGTALLRVAHLSPDSPAVDVTLDDPASAEPPLVLSDVGYGDVSASRTVPAGRYTVAVRGAGADPGRPPVLSTVVDLAPGAARTVAATGAFADLSLAVLDDDLTAPGDGSARVRVLAAAAGAGTVDVRLGAGPPVAADLAFGAAGRYVDVPAGPATARIAPTGQPAVSVPLVVEPGAVYSLLVLDDDGGGTTARLVRDAAGPAAPPVGGVAAGVVGATVPARPGLLSRLLAPLADLAARARGDVPLGLRVPAIGVDAALSAVGPDAAGSLGAPDDPARAGWLATGPVPGDAGPAVVTGHVSYRGPAVFGRLAELAPGSEVLVDRADGSTARFVVTRVARYPKTAFPTAEVYGPTPDAQLRLITCGGDLDPQRHTYADNVVVFAVSS